MLAFFFVEADANGPSQEAGLEAVPVKEEAAASTDGGDGEAGFASVTKPLRGLEMSPSIGVILDDTPKILDEQNEHGEF